MSRIGSPATWIRAFVLLAAAAMLAAPAGAEIDLRVQSRPIGSPILAFLRVTDDQNGGPITGLTAADFAATLDGVALNNTTFSLPPDQDPTQRISIVFVIDHSTSVQDLAGDAIRDGVTDFINQMALGDYAAIVKFNATSLATVVQPFTLIDGAGNTGNNALVAAVDAAYPGEGTNLFDALFLAVDQFLLPAPVLPNGPKAVILIGDGEDNSSVATQSDFVDYANQNAIPVFTVSVGDISTIAVQLAVMTSLAEDTGGEYIPAPDEAQIAEAYATLSSLLNNAYLLTIPQTAATECDQQYQLEVTVQGQANPASVLFTRCDSTPDDFSFVDVTGVAPGAVVTSNVVSITGIDSPTAISVVGGEYSVGCGAMFTAVAGIVSFEDEVCVRHAASAIFSTASAPTVLTVGGVSSSFTSTTHAAPPPPNNGGGGGGATGVIELLLGLGALFGRRRRPG